MLEKIMHNMDVVTPSDIERAIQRTFKDYRLPIVILEVDATYDYIGYYEPHVDKKLSGFGYSDRTDGYHVLKFDTAKQVSPTGIAFKKYQQDNFYDVALCREHLPVADRPPAEERFVPRPMLIENGWEPATILSTAPTGVPPRVARPEFDYDKVHADVKALIPMNEHFESRLAQWRDFIARRPNDDASYAAVELPQWMGHTRRPANAAQGTSAAEIARSTVLASTIAVRQPRTVVSAAYNGAEGNADRAARAADDAEAAGIVETEPLKAGTWAFVKVKYPEPSPNDTGSAGCRIPLILVQLAADFGDVDTTLAESKIKVSWWAPAPAHGRYDGDWRKWRNAQRQQHETEEERGSIAMTDVKFTREAELAGGVRRLNKKTKERLAETNMAGVSLYSQYSRGPPS